MSGERRSASRARARVVGQSRGVGEVQTRKTFLLSRPRLGTDRRTPTREDGFFLSSRDESSRRSASSASRDAPSSPRSPSSTSPSVGPCPRPSRTRTRCSFRHTLRSAGATGRANKCRFLPTATRDGSRRRGKRWGARAATACVCACAAGGRERAASRALSGDTRGTGGRGRVFGNRDTPRASFVRFPSAPRRKKYDRPSRAARVIAREKADATFLAPFPRFPVGDLR